MGDDKQNLESVINDAVVALRPQFRAARHLEEGRQLAIHNENYGLIRNLTGLRPIWFIVSIISAIVSLGQLLRARHLARLGDTRSHSFAAGDFDILQSANVRSSMCRPIC